MRKTKFRVSKQIDRLIETKESLEFLKEDDTQASLTVIEQEVIRQAIAVYERYIERLNKELLDTKYAIET